jgi:hypothetical protein
MIHEEEKQVCSKCVAEDFFLTSKECFSPKTVKTFNKQEDDEKGEKKKRIGQIFLSLRIVSRSC